MTDQTKLPTKTDFLLYQTDDCNIRLETRMENETIWLTQAQMCKLFDNGAQLAYPQIQKKNECQWHARRLFCF